MSLAFLSEVCMPCMGDLPFYRHPVKEVKALKMLHYKLLYETIFLVTLVISLMNDTIFLFDQSACSSHMVQCCVFHRGCHTDFN